MNIQTQENCSDILGTVPISRENQDTVTFVDEACVSTEVGGNYSGHSKLKNELKSVEDYLARPYKLATIALGSTVNAYPIVGSDALMLSASNRLRGALGFRFTIKFRLQVVASPFSSGLYKLVWLPQDSLSRVSTAQLAHVSQMKGVEINLQDNTECELTVPYTHYVDYVPIRTSDWGSNRYGVVAIIPMIAAYAGGAVPAVTATLWYSLHDIELEGKSAFSVVSGVVQAYGAAITAGAVSTGVTAKAIQKVSEGVSANAKETKSENKWWAKVANVGLTLSKVVGDAAWFAAIVGETAFSLGFSRPIKKETLDYMRRSAFFNPGLDTALAAIPLATQNDCTINCIKGIGSDVNEMAIVNFISVPSIVAKFTLSTTDGVESIKFVSDVTPMACFYNNAGITAENHNPSIVISAGSLGNIWPSPLFYVGQTFAQWRGSIRFTFKTAKTRFHSGRLRIAFLPYAQPTTSTTPYVQDPLYPVDNITAIWDLRESSELDFVCPYMCPFYWTQNFEVMGSISVTVLEPLIAPDTVSPSLDFLVYVSGEPDFEFSLPIAPRYTPVTSALSNYQLDAPEYPGSGPALLAEFDTMAGEVQSLTTQDANGSQVTIGESILSIKQLISRPCYRLMGDALSDVNAISHWWGETPSTLTSQLDSSTNSYWASAFYYARGGSIIRILPYINNFKSFIQTVYATKAPTDVSVKNDGLSANICMETVSTNETILPFSQQTSKVPTCGNYGQIPANGVTSGSTTYLGWGIFNRCWFIFGSRYTAGTIVSAVSVTAADDAQLFWQMPCPPLQVGSVAAGKNYYGKISTEFPQQNAITTKLAANY